MNKVASVAGSSPSNHLHLYYDQWRGHRHSRSCSSPQISLSIRGRNSKKSRYTKPSDSNLEMVIDIEDLTNRASLSIRRFTNMSRLKFNHFVSSGKEACRDLQTLITVDDNRRVIISCRRSSVRFVGSLIILSCVIAFAIRFFVKLVLELCSGLGIGNGALVRRDRSLGGREVVVGRRAKGREGKVKKFRVPGNPLSPAQETTTAERSFESNVKNYSRTKEDKLPSWWPSSLPPPTLVIDKEDHQREGKRILRAIMDNRMSGKDISGDDIMELRRLCRISGLRVSFDTANSRDSFYRASVEFVLNICSRGTSGSSSVQIDGEDAPQFLAGLAHNIGIEIIRASTIVCGAVAARTRSRFLQAWALEMQGKHSEALMEVSKICLIHQMFPPEESSPEMEMVARGLEQHLKVEQRKFLLNMIAEVCGEASRRSVAEALGLVGALNNRLRQ